MVVLKSLFQFAVPESLHYRIYLIRYKSRRALQTETPNMIGSISYVIFNPLRIISCKVKASSSPLPSFPYWINKNVCAEMNHHMNHHLNPRNLTVSALRCALSVCPLHTIYNLTTIPNESLVIYIYIYV